jgi:hypothetical protein
VKETNQRVGIKTVFQLLMVLARRASRGAFLHYRRLTQAIITMLTFHADAHGPVPILEKGIDFT